jgi:hypothetical protein
MHIKFLLENLKGQNLHRWWGMIEMDLSKSESKGVIWIHLAQNGIQWWVFVNTIMKILVP